MKGSLTAMQVRSTLFALALLALAPLGRAADLGSLCRDCQLQVGVGGTYHYWGSTGGGGVTLTPLFCHKPVEGGGVPGGDPGRVYEFPLGGQRADSPADTGG